MKVHNSLGGFVLLELLLALLILEIGILGVTQLFLNSSKAYLNNKTSLHALELLRGEVEKLENRQFYSICSCSLTELEEGIWFSLEVQNVNENFDFLPEYKILRGLISWKDTFGIMRSYQLVTYKKR